MLNRALIILSALAAFTSCSFKEIELQWNPSWRTDVPYELVFTPERLSGTDWVAKADGEPLETRYFFDGTYHRLRFSVPDGTRAMSLARGANHKVCPDTLCNLYAGFKDAGSYKVEVPAWAAGRPARMELDAENLGDMPITVKMHFLQYYADGTRIPEEVSDGRWTTHSQPPHLKTCYRERAYIHPDAKWIELFVNVDSLDASFDLEGKPIGDLRTPKMQISHIAIRPAAEYPFPGINKDFFAEGISPREYDHSLDLSGLRTFVYQTRSWASWAGGYQMRDPDDFFYPAAGGTVEAWFKPDWDSSIQAEGEYIPLFEASHHASIAYTHANRFALGRQLFLTYDPRSGQARLELGDADMKKFSAEAEVKIEDGEWNHLAVTFQPTDKACLYVNGHKVLTMPLKGYRTVDIENVEFPNDRHAMEFYVGASYVNARGFTENDRAWQNIPDWCSSWYSGCVDALRVSSSVRYDSDFIPDAEYALDRETRALFDFNEDFEGRSGDGIGVIHGTMMCKENRNTLTVPTDKGQLQYYPEEVAPENDPDRLLKQQNYPQVPGEKDFDGSFVNVKESFDVKPGDDIKVKAPDELFMDYVEIENTSDTPLVNPFVRHDEEVDFRSFAGVSRTLKHKENPVSLFNYLIGASDYFMTYLASFEKHSDIPFCAKDESVTVLGSYCGFECGPLNKLTACLYASACGIPSSPISGYGHEYQQIFYDGRNHIYDLSGQRFYVDMDNESAAGQEGFEDQPAVLERAGTSPGHFVRMGTRMYYNNEQIFPEIFSMNINPGERLRLHWANNGTSNDLQSGGASETRPSARTDYRSQTGASGKIWRVDRFIPEYGNGFLLFDAAPSDYPATFVEVTDESFCYLVESCYPVVSAIYEAVLSDGSKPSLEISTDGLRTFRPVKGELKYQVRGRRGYYIRVNAPIESVAGFKAYTVLHTNTRVQTGKLLAGNNILHFTAEEEGSARVTLSYDVRAKEIKFEGALKYGSLKGQEKNLIAFDPAESGRIPVSGTGKDAVAECSEGLEAVLNGGTLEISSLSCEPFFGWVKIADGMRYKYLTVLSCPGVRTVHFNKTLSEKDSSAVGSFAELSPGEYAVLSLERFSGGVPSRRDRVVSLEFGGNRTGACSPVNTGCDYYKAAFGPVSGRGNWKWDYPLSSEYSYPFEEMLYLSTDAPVSTLAYTMTDFKYGEMELAAALVIPAPSRDFKCEIIRNLCGLNTRPWIK